jgi:Domain of unknown function (DUF4395)
VAVRILHGVSERRRLSQFFTFPDPVNETSARLVAAGVVLQGVLFLALRQWWVLVPLVFGFVARVAAGPRFSPLGRFVTEVVTPRLHRTHRMVPGPPKRFAQAMGLTFSASALVAALLGGGLVAIVLIAGLVVAAALESFAGLCLGCMVFQRLMQWGLIPQSVCLSCNDIGSRLNAG